MSVSHSVVTSWLYRGRHQQIESCFRAKLPNVNAWQGLASLSAGKGKFLAAEFLCRKALSIDPTHEESLIALSGVLIYFKQYDEAEEILTKLIERDLESRYQVEQNLGFLMLEIGQTSKALDLLIPAYEHAPEEAKAGIKYGIGYARLKNGDLRAGFTIVQEQWNTPNSHIWGLGIPEWNGDISALKGARILVHHYQGYGDTIQFSRFMKRLCDYGAYVIAAVPKPLLRILDSPDLTNIVVDINEPLPPVDYHVSVSSLPALLKIELNDLPNIEFPYLHSTYIPGNKESFPLPHRNGNQNVGIIWKADKYGSGPRRSIPLECFLPLTLIPHATIYSLQFEGIEDIARLGVSDLITDLSYSIRDFADLAERIEEMDIMVCADTGPLHLVGALNRPCIALLSFAAADWRWLEHDRKDNPWYPSMQVIRQSKSCSWDEVIEQVIPIISNYSYDAY
jgi:tetratricopeptide (TPR) repeat protein